MKNYQIFVAGIPCLTSAQEVTMCFSRLNYVVRVEQSSFPTLFAKNQRLVVDGHCVISVKNLSSYEGILSHGEIKLKGRKLMCKPYLTGVNLYKLNAQNNKRRIILKSVPSFLYERDVRHSLEKKFGKIEQFFPFLSDNRTPEESKRKFTSYSVMFEDVNSALWAVEANVVELKEGIYANIEKFSRKRKELNDQKQTKTTLGNFSTIEDLGKRNHEPTTLDNLVKDRRAKRKLLYKPKSFRRRHRSLVNQPCKDNLPYQTLQDRSTRSLERTTLIPAGYQRLELIEELCAKCSHLKPNSKIYRLLRCENFEYSATFELKNTWISSNNLRHNVLKKEPRKNERQKK